MGDAALDVLIVGAGPVGLVLACELVRHGLRCRIIDMQDQPSVHSKAHVIHSRTLEILADMQIIEPFLGCGRWLQGIAVYTPDLNCLARLPFLLPSIETRYPHSLSIAQADTERLLLTQLHQLGVWVERPVSLQSFSQDADGVSAVLQHASGCTESIYATWLVGCDGAHSTVRKGLQLPLEGAAGEQRILQADLRIDWNFASAEEQAVGFLAESGMLGIFPLPGKQHYRMLTLLAPDDPAEATLATFEELMAERGPKGAKVRDPEWMVDFRFHRRMVPRYRSGRVFLAGEAAHTHSPIGGHGMNTGMQDSYNLAWKLALVQKGHAAAALLDSYHSERHPVAAATLRGSDILTRRFQSVFHLRPPLSGELRGKFAAFVAGMEMVQHRATPAISMLEVAYPHSPIVAEDRTSALAASLGIEPHSEGPSFADWLDFGQGPAPGERAHDAELPAAQGQPRRLYEHLHGTGHTLLLFDGAAATAEGYRRLADIQRQVREHYGSHVIVHIVVPHSRIPAELPADSSILLDSEGEVHRRYGARSECIFLIRPDKYIAYRCQPADGEKLLTFLKRIFVE